MFKYSLNKEEMSKFKNKYDIMRAVYQHDPDTAIFSFRVAQINAAICIEMGMENNQIEKYFLCGLFHDVGKLGMSYDFLNYQGKYTLEMYQEMKKHTVGGKQLLERVGSEKEVAETAYYHHCNYDGTGYPTADGAKSIPIHGRLTRISDSIDAYMTKRCYKEGGPAKEVLRDVYQFTGKSYDPELIEKFSIVHNNVMQKCHAEGLDHPSQDVYMMFLNQQYDMGFTQKETNKIFQNQPNE